MGSQFVGLEPDGLGGGLDRERLNGWMIDGLGDPIGQILINGGKYTH